MLLQAAEIQMNTEKIPNWILLITITGAVALESENWKMKTFRAAWRTKGAVRVSPTNFH